MNETGEQSLVKRGLPDRDLGILLGILRRLHHQIRALLWQTWMDKHRPTETPRADVDIANRMRDHLERAAAEAGKGAGHNADPRDHDRPYRTPLRGRGQNKHKLDGKDLPLTATEFSRHLQNTGGGRVMEPRLLGERMQKSTLEHINQALLLARSGDTAGAKLHAGLAENAMKTAAHHMAPASFASFSAAVEERLRTLEGQPPRSAP